MSREEIDAESLRYKAEERRKFLMGEPTVSLHDELMHQMKDKGRAFRFAWFQEEELVDFPRKRPEGLSIQVIDPEKFGGGIFITREMFEESKLSSEEVVVLRLQEVGRIIDQQIPGNVEEVQVYGLKA